MTETNNNDEWYDLEENKEEIEKFAIKARHRDIFDDVWELLDGVMKMNGDTIWYNPGVTAHERLIDIADKYDHTTGNMLQDRIEKNS